MTVRDAPSIRRFPTRTLPVKLLFRHAGSSSIAWPMGSGSPLTRFRTPGGTPASATMFAISIAVRGVYSEARPTTVHPAAMAAAHARPGL